MIKNFVKLSMRTYHLVWAFLSAAFYGFPSRKLTVIGVTGTNGKSTVVWLLARILEHAGHRVAAASSIEFQIAGKHRQNQFKMTMPGRGFLQKFLRDAVKAKCAYAVVEVTSEGVRQYRHRFIDFAVSVFLNISPEHIERHGGFFPYRAAKRNFFQTGKTLVINTGSVEAPFFLEVAEGKPLIGFRMGDHPVRAALPAGSRELVAEDIVATADGIAFTVAGVRVAAPLSGRFNVENAIAAIAAAFAVGVPIEKAVEALRDVAKTPGRFERIPNDRGITIIVDYAHTPEALRSVYEAAKAETAPLTCVLGAAGGGRDVWKRQELGKLSARFCESIIITDEDPYDENPKTIRDAVLAGVREGGAGERTQDISDRREAIRKAIEETPRGGAVVITGKGSEPWMMLANGKKLAWDDRAVVREELARIAADR